MEKQEKEILDWLLCAEDYLLGFSKLIQLSLDENKSNSKRPTILLFGYFLEDLVKAGIIKKKNLEESEIRIHISLRLLSEIEYPDLTKNESDLIEFLSENIIWGKYPVKGKGDKGQMISSHSDATLKVYANETVFFNDFNNIELILNLSLKVLNYVSSILFENMIAENKIYFSATLGRIQELILTNLHKIKNRNIKNNVSDKYESKINKVLFCIKDLLKRM